MGLEVAQFIPELVDTNPLGNDPKSEGDDHLRTIKTAVQGSFPAFVGTSVSPEFVTLSEVEINDAALKSAAQTIIAPWLFESAITLGDNISLLGLDGVTPHNIGAVGGGLVSLGSNLNETRLNAANEITSRIQGSDHAKMVTSDAGGVVMQDRARLGFLKAGYRNPRRFSLNANANVIQDYEGAIVSINTGNITLTLDALETNTRFKVVCASGSAFAVEGAGAIIQRFDGSQRIDGDFTMGFAGVYEWWMPTPSIWYVWQVAGV